MDSRPRPDAGSATVEFALVLPLVVTVMALVVSAGAWVLRIDAAQHGANEAARVALTGSHADAVAVGEQVSGSPVVIVHANGFATACVTAHRAPWPDVVRCASTRDQ